MSFLRVQPYIRLAGCDKRVKMEPGYAATEIIMVGSAAKVLRRERNLLILTGGSFKIDSGCKMKNRKSYVTGVTL